MTRQAYQTSDGLVIELEPYEAAQGVVTPILIPAISGQGPRQITARIPAGIRDGNLIRLAGQGTPTETGEPQSDLLIRVRVKIQQPSSPPPSPRRRRQALVIAGLVAVIAVIVVIGVSSPFHSKTTVLPTPGPIPATDTPWTYVPSYTLPAPPLNRRLANGTLITPPAGGVGELTINNGGTTDAVIFLVPVGSRRSALAVYVQGPGQYTADGIPNGQYQIYVISGSDWDPSTNTFTQYPDRFVFDETADYTSDGIAYSITITPVAGGNASTRPVDPYSFPTN